MAFSLKILLFGPARDAMDGESTVSVECDHFPVSIEQLRTIMNEKFPALRFVLMNAVFALDNQLIPRNNETSVGKGSRNQTSG